MTNKFATFYVEDAFKQKVTFSKPLDFISVIFQDALAWECSSFLSSTRGSLLWASLCNSRNGLSLNPVGASHVVSREGGVWQTVWAVKRC